MCAAAGGNPSRQLAARQRKVAKQVQRLVADAFILETKFVVDRTVGRKYQQILAGHAGSEPLASEPLRFGLKNEGPGGSKSLKEAVRLDVNFQRLASDRWLRVIIQLVVQNQGPRGVPLLEWLSEHP